MYPKVATTPENRENQDKSENSGILYTLYIGKTLEIKNYKFERNLITLYFNVFLCYSLSSPVQHFRYYKRGKNIKMKRMYFADRKQDYYIAYMYM